MGSISNCGDKKETEDSASPKTVGYLIKLGGVGNGKLYSLHIHMVTDNS